MILNHSIISMMAGAAEGGPGSFGGGVVMELVRAFLVGGIICALAQILLDRTKMMPGRVMVTLVVAGNILGWLGLYEPFFEMGRSRGRGAASRLWKYPVEGCRKSIRRRGTHWNLQRQSDRRFCWNRRGASVRVSGGAGV